MKKVLSILVVVLALTIALGCFAYADEFAGEAEYEEAMLSVYPTYADAVAALNALGYTTEVSYVAPTCTVMGDVGCVNSDNDYLGAKIAALGHDFSVEVIAVEPTCTSEGLRKWECSRCGLIDESLNEVIGADHHRYRPEFLSITYPTCTEPGSFEGRIRCEICGDVIEDKYDELNSIFSSYGLDVPNPNWHTYNADETYVWYRPVLNQSFYDAYFNPVEVEMTGNPYYDPDQGMIEELAPTCVDDGIAVQICNNPNCTAKLYTPIPALGHDYHETKEERIDCYTAEITYTCTRCKDWFTENQAYATRLDTSVKNYDDAVAEGLYWVDYDHHRYGDWGEDYAPTCYDLGQDKRECAECGFTQYAEVPELGHDMGEWIMGTAPDQEHNIKGYWYRTCNRCGYRQDLTATWDAFTGSQEWLDEQAVANVEKYKDTGIVESHDVFTLTEAMCEHEKSDLIVDVAATCTDDGEGHYVCVKCGNFLGSEVIPATGHTAGEAVKENEVPATCTEAGSYDEVFYCTVCDAEISRETKTIEALGHTEEVIPAVDPTFTTVGWTEGKKCSVCGEILVAPEEIPMLIPRNGFVFEDEQFKFYKDDIFQEDLTDVVEFKGEEFFVDKGIACTDANGLAQAPDGTWYFIAAGRIVKEHTGFAEYDGAWFYISDGKLDTSKTGLFDYMDGTFVLAEGRLIDKYSGLYQENDVWYFIAGGQFQNQFTGLCEYDGEWFYLIDGILAVDYTGTVEYDGETFEVANGMVVA